MQLYLYRPKNEGAKIHRLRAFPRLTVVCHSGYPLGSLSSRHPFVGLVCAGCLFIANYSTAAEKTQSNRWEFTWHIVANPAGGHSAVQAVRRVPHYVPNSEKEALKEEEEFDRAFFKPPDDKMGVVLDTGNNSTNGTELLFKFFRGPFYSSTNALSAWRASATGEQKQNWVTVVSTIDNTRLVIGVDGGPIYSSTNSGMSWDIISAPGKYSLPIVSGDGNCGILAVQTIQASAKSTTNMPVRNWYAVASGADGSGLIATGGALPSSPVLDISRSDNGLIISWPSFATRYVLQQNLDLTTTNWVSVPVEPSILNGQFRVIQPTAIPNKFYRLITK